MKLFSFLILFTFLLSACTKDGGVGPQGPQGPTGNANVKGENATNVSWTYVSNLHQFTATINDNDITQDIVSNGVVMVYININGSWWALPNQDGVNSTTYGYNVGVVNLVNSNSDSTIPNTPLNTTFRVVVISG